jgi:hypothetical protein
MKSLLDDPGRERNENDPIISQTLLSLWGLGSRRPARLPAVRLTNGGERWPSYRYKQRGVFLSDATCASRPLFCSDTNSSNPDRFPSCRRFPTTGIQLSAPFAGCLSAASATYSGSRSQKGRMCGHCRCSDGCPSTSCRK